MSTDTIDKPGPEAGKKTLRLRDRLKRVFNTTDLNEDTGEHDIVVRHSPDDAVTVAPEEVQPPEA